MLKSRLVVLNDKVIDALKEMHDNRGHFWVTEDTGDMLEAVLVASHGANYTIVLHAICQVAKNETRLLEARWFV